MAKANVVDVASFFIALASDTGEQLTHMKLQKLLYYSQAWYLGIYNEPLFDSSIEAWKFGPVCPEIYHEYKKYGNNNIPFTGDCQETEGCLPIVEAKIHPDVMGFLHKIADDYMGFTAIALSNMSHQEKPWKDAMSDASVITKDVMRAYYSNLVLDETEIEEVEKEFQSIRDGKCVEWRPGMYS